MTMSDFCTRLEALMELDPGSVQPATMLSELPTWDSVSRLGFMALADEVAGAQLSGTEIAQCQSVSDLARLLGETVAGA
jgi:acyl carrier protein